ncbi:hypothetical protein BIFDEN_01704 [Bifidobacterium dentium ATCC 27678]|nr:hypothetical protein BIFDEN_01704 [Bifidobacterium dentium ATCC 27678]
MPETGEGGPIMAENADSQTEPDTPPETDWQAKYEEAISHSRTWEERSKANYADVQKLSEELAALKAAKPDAKLAAATKRADEAEAALASYRHDAEIAGWKAATEKETGIPADLLTGDTEDAIKASAVKLAEFLKSRPTAPHFANPAGTPNNHNTTPDPATEAICTALFGPRH